MDSNRLIWAVALAAVLVSCSKDESETPLPSGGSDAVPEPVAEAATPAKPAAPTATAAGATAGSAAESGASIVDRDQIKGLFAREFGQRVERAPQEWIDLGRTLYHAEQLSTNGNISCASCHDLNRFGQDNLPVSPGTDGQPGERSSPPSVNAFRQVAQFWDGRAATVEEQAQGPVLNPIEHGFGDQESFLEALRGLGMEGGFAQCFPDDPQPVSLANFGKVVGAFERILVTRSRFDSYLSGVDTALTDEEKQGLKTFVDVNCTMCHNGRAVGGGMFMKLGLVKPYKTGDIGRAAVTGNDAEKHVFKVPMLLNVAETAPYLHDGSISSLPEVVRVMGEHQLGIELSDEQVASIVTFLEALTGDLVER